MANASIVKQRLSTFLKNIGSNNNQFIVRMGYAPTFLNSDGGISESKLSEIAKTYPELDMNWLLTGSGSMFKNISENSENVSEQNKDDTRNNDIVNTNEDVPMSEILEFMKLVSVNMDNQLKSFNQQMSEQRAEMREQRAMMMSELKEQRLSMMTELKEQRVATIKQFEKLYDMMEKQFTELAKRNHDESEILKTMVNKIAQVDEKTGRIIQLQKGVG